VSAERVPRFWAGCGYTATDRRNLRRFNAWTFVWMAIWLAATWLFRGEAVTAGPLAWALVLITVLLGLQVMRSYVHFLRQADELLGKIQMEALALGFGAGMVFMVAYRLCERLGAPRLDSSDPMVVMIFVWAFSQWLVARRYR